MTIRARWCAAAASLALLGQPAFAQVRTVDPSSAQAHSDLAPPGSGQPETSGGDTQPFPEASDAAPPSRSAPPPSDVDRANPPATNASHAPDSQTYQGGDVIDAAENVFGRGAEGLAKLIERILKDQGRPTAYIAGREASGAFAVGLRYGSGVMHKVEGDQTVYWTGPTLGFDVGGN